MLGVVVLDVGAHHEVVRTQQATPALDELSNELVAHLVGVRTVAPLQHEPAAGGRPEVQRAEHITQVGSALQGKQQPSDDRPETARLRAGQNVTLDGAEMAVRVRWRPGGPDLDVSALLLGDDGHVRSDADFVFYNQPASPDGSVKHIGKSVDGLEISDGVDIALGANPVDVDRVVIAVSVDGGAFAGVEGLHVVATMSGSSFTFTPTAATEAALVCAEVYRRNGAWRLRAVGQGYDVGLAGLARDYGVDVG